MTTRCLLVALVLSAVVLAVPAAEAQSVGTFRWQLQPYCNVVTVAIFQTGGVYRLEGTDDQCGGGRDLASVQGLAFPNPDGGIGFGMTIVTAPGGAPVHVDAEIALATLSGSWRDSAGATGNFTFSPGASSGGSPRPQPSASVPASIRLLTDGALVAGGAVNAGTVPASGAGTRMMWYPGKASFRAGYVDGPHWDDANIGPYSVAMGLNTTASGPRSTAFGEVTSASGAGSTAMGVGTRANGAYATAMGLSTAANGLASLAAGQQTLAAGISATAFGLATQANGNYATAIGRNTIAGGDSSFAGGSTSRASGVYAFAFGVDAEAGGTGSFALGRTARTTAAAAGSLMFADLSSSAPFVSNAPNEVGVRAAGGVYLYTRADLGTGVALAANGSSWAARSESTSGRPRISAATTLRGHSTTR